MNNLTSWQNESNPLSFEPLYTQILAKIEINKS